MTVLTTSERTLKSAEAVCEPPPGAQVVRSAGIVFLAVLLSRLTGLVREIVMANRFGAGFVYDAFLLGFRIPNLTRDLFAEGALSYSFVPTFATSLLEQDKQRASELANLVTSAMIAIVGGLCLLGMWLAPHLVWLLAPGFASVPGKFALAVRLTRIMFPFLLLVALAAQSTGMLNSHGSFGVPAIASIFFNLGSVGFGLLLGYVVGPYLGIAPIEGMAYGVVVGGALQFAWQRAKLHRLGYRFRFVWNWSNPGLRRMGSLMAPAIIGSLAVQVSLIITTNLASTLSDPLRGHDGPVSWLGYALRFVQVPLALFGAAMASALLPSIARSAAAHNFDEFRKTLARSLGTVFLLTIPSSLILMALGKPFIGVIYQSGRFDSYDTAQTGMALSCYAAGLAGFAAHRVLNPAFFALSDARTPMLISLSSIAVYLLFPLLLLRLWHAGFWALALTPALAVLMECLLLAARLRRKLGGLEGRYLLNSFLRITGASAVMFFPLLLLHSRLCTLLPQTRLGYAAELAVSLPPALALFFAAARALKVEEMRFVYQYFVAPTWLRFAGSAPLARLHVKIQG